MFRDDRMPVLEKYTAQAEREYERLESLQKELAQVQQEISRIREQHEKDLPKVNSLTEEIGGMDRELKVLAGTQKVAKDTTERLRDEREILQGKVLEITEAVGALQDELKRLNARVVHSPEKLKQSIQSLSESITTARTQLVHRETESRQLSTKIEMLQELLNEIRACLQQMSDAEAIVHRHEDELRKLAAEKENVNQETSNLKNLGVREEQLKFQGQSAKDKIERLKANRQAKREQSEARIKRLEAEDKEVASKFGEMSAKMVERRGRYDELQEEIKNCKSTMDMDAVAIQECYEKLRQQTLEYQDNVILSLEELLTHFYE
ncbi:kinetochore-associated Ndc80 complex subunit nuf2 [Linderina macrospora]|uniref:Kinetochore-associated Ndc80 complex subunit nuf2 n=1 Tax=Linderina macrospora TaxID=4868 RepID=A0ACC1J3H1_9FUNG|nr:kinetochore-associated Ndc80 complex subunit nuf2 [Linderina macrospora]